MGKILFNMMVAAMVASALWSSAMAAENKPIRIYGSSSMAAWVETMGEAFMKDHPEINVTLISEGTLKGIGALLEGNAEIALASRQILPEERKIAEDKGMRVREVPAGKGAILFFVTNDVGVDSLSLGQIRKIFKGELLNWREVGGPDKKIETNSLEYPSRGPAYWMKNQILKDADFGSTVDFRRNSRQLLLHCSSEEGSIGFMGSYDFRARHRHMPTLALKPIRIRNDDASPAIPADEGTVRDGSYPCTTSYYLYYDDSTASPALRNFVQYCMDNGDKQSAPLAMTKQKAE